MPRDGSGTYQLPAGNPVVTGTPISSAVQNSTMSDVATALTNSVSRDGQAPLTANLPAGGNKLTGLAAGTQPGDSVRFEQLFSQGLENTIASAATTDIGSINSNFIVVSGTTTITSFGSNFNGPKFIRFSGALRITNSASMVIQGGGDIVTNAGDIICVYPLANPATGWQVAIYTPVIPVTFGQCRLTLSAGSLLLSRYNGNKLTINGVPQTIPAPGPTLAATGLTATTLYYIYAYMSGTTMTLEVSTTTHSTDSSTGVEIKSGDATRTLVGMVRPVTGPAFADSATQRFVRSYFNRPTITTINSFTATRSTTALALTEVNTEIRSEWLQWADEAPTASIQGSANNSGANIYTLTAIGWDGTPDSNTSNCIASATGLFGNCSTTSHKYGLSEGYHYATLMGQNSAASTASWASIIPGIYTSLMVKI